MDCHAEADVFAVSDSLGGMIRNYLEIKNYSENLDSPGATASAATDSPEAFGYYIHAYESYEKMDMGTTIELLLEAWCNKAYSKRDQLPIREKLFLDHLYAYFYETPLEEIKYCKLILEMDEMNSVYWFMLGDAFNKLEQYEKAVNSFEKSLKSMRSGEPPFAFLTCFFGWAMLCTT